MTRLTVVFPTLNEEKDLGRTLKSLKNLKADVLIIDSGSTDNTVKIAKKHGAKVINHPFKSFSNIRNFGNSLVKSGWILALEADVVVTKKLAQEINRLLTQSSITNSAYFIPRINIIWGKKIMHTDWGPKDDLHIWLYKKGSGSWQGKVHEEYKIKQGTVGHLKNYLLHYNYETVSEFIGKINSYSTAAVTQKSSFPFYWPFRDFFKRYIYKKGFQDGYHGLFLSYLQAIYYHVLRVKVYQRKNV
jgi:glycosyltransferase involved in cell wall biosynthesis